VRAVMGEQTKARTPNYEGGGRFDPAPAPLPGGSAGRGPTPDHVGTTGPPAGAAPAPDHGLQAARETDMQLRTHLLAAGLLAAAPAFAVTHIYPGTICQVEGESERTLNGALANMTQLKSRGVTWFHCPIVRTRTPTVYPYTVSLKLNILRNDSPDGWQCDLRAVDLKGDVPWMSIFYTPNKAQFDPVPWTSGTSLNVPSGVAIRSYTVNCWVPDVYLSTAAALVSLEITD